MLGAIIGLLRVLQRGFLHGDVGQLQIRIDREDRRAQRHLVALAHRQRLDAAGLVGTDEDQLGFDPALVASAPCRCRSRRGRGPRPVRGQAPCDAGSWRVPFAEQKIEVGTHQLAHVERREAAEQAVPQDRHEPGRDQQLRKARQRVVTQLTALDRAREQRPHRRDHARDHLVVIEFRQLGKARPSAMIRRITSLRRVPKISRTNRSTNALRRAARTGMSALGVASIAPTSGTEHRAHELLEQALLVAEVEIDRAFGDAGAAGDVVEPRRRKTARRKFLKRGRKDGFAPLGASRRARVMLRLALAGRGLAALGLAAIWTMLDA